MKVLVTDITWADTRVEDAVLADGRSRDRAGADRERGRAVELVRDADAILTCFAHVTRASLPRASGCG